MAIVFLTVTACVREDAADFCSAHANYHTAHQDAVVDLELDMTDPGRLRLGLRIPAAIYRSGAQTDTMTPDALAALLRNPSNVYTVADAAGCDDAKVELRQDREALLADYNAVCSGDERLRQLEVTLFDTIPTIDEVSATIDAAAVRKKFLISRQCDNALFGIDRTIAEPADSDSAR